MAAYNVQDELQPCCRWWRVLQIGGELSTVSGPIRQGIHILELPTCSRKPKECPCGLRFNKVNSCLQLGVVPDGASSESEGLQWYL